MKAIKFTSKIIPFILIPSIYISFFPGKIILITTICLFPFLFYYVKRFLFEKPKLNENKDNIIFIKIYLLYGFTTFIRGVFTINNLDDFSRLFGTSIYYYILFPLIIYYLNSYIFIKYVRSYVFYGIIAIIIISINGGGKGNSDVPHMISGFYVIGLMLPYLNEKRWWILILSMLIYVLTTNMGTRINIVNCCFFFFLLILFYLKQSLNFISKRLAIIFFLSPIILLILGITGIFNIFKIGDMIQTNIVVSGGVKKSDRDLLVDSRTSIYEDVFNELDEKNAYLIGLTANGKTQTSLSDIDNANFYEIYKNGRPGTESGMLNQIQYGGILGLICYSLLFIRATYLAIWQSKNRYMILIGIYISFKYFLSFIEDRMDVGIHYFFIIIAIALSFSSRLRNFNDDEMKLYIRNIFNKKII